MTTGRINQVAKELSSRPAGTWTGTSDAMVGTRHGPAQGQERNEREHTEMMPSRPYRYISLVDGASRTTAERETKRVRPSQAATGRQAPTDRSRPSAHCPETDARRRICRTRNHRAGHGGDAFADKWTFGVAISTRRRRRIRNTLSTFPLRVPTGQDCQS